MMLAPSNATITLDSQLLEPLPFEVGGRNVSIKFSPDGRYALCMGYPVQPKRRDLPTDRRCSIVDTAYGRHMPMKPIAEYNMTITNSGEVVTFHYGGHISIVETKPLKMLNFYAFDYPVRPPVTLLLNNDYVLGIGHGNRLWLRQLNHGKARQYQLTVEQTGEGTYNSHPRMMNARVSPDGQKLFMMARFQEHGYRGPADYLLLGISDDGIGNVKYELFNNTDDPADFGHFLQDDRFIYRVNTQYCRKVTYALTKINWEPAMRLQPLRQIECMNTNSHIVASFGWNLVLREEEKQSKFSVWKLRPASLLKMAHLIARDVAPNWMWPPNPPIVPLLPYDSNPHTN